MNRVILAVFSILTLVSCNSEQTENTQSNDLPDWAKIIVSEDPPCFLSSKNVNRDMLTGAQSQYLEGKDYIVMPLGSCEAKRFYQDGSWDVIDTGYDALAVASKPGYTLTRKAANGKEIIEVQFNSGSSNPTVDMEQVATAFGTTEVVTKELTVKDAFIKFHGDLSHEQGLRFQDFKNTFVVEDLRLELDVTGDPNFFLEIYNTGFVVLKIHVGLEGQNSLLTEEISPEVTGTL